MMVDSAGEGKAQTWDAMTVMPTARAFCTASQFGDKIYDLSDQQVATLLEGFQHAGEHQIKCNADGFPVGIYFYTLRTEEFVRTGKLVIQN